MRLSGLLCAAVAFLLYDCAATTTNTLTDSTNKDTRSLRSVDAEREDREERGIGRIGAKVKGWTTKLVDLPISPAKLREARRRKALNEQLAQKALKAEQSAKADKNAVLELSGKTGTDFDDFLKQALNDDDFFKKVFSELHSNTKVYEVVNRLYNLKTTEAEALAKKIAIASEAYDNKMHDAVALLKQ